MNGRPAQPLACRRDSSQSQSGRIGASSAARLANEQWLEVRQPNMVWPSIGADPYRVRASVVRAIDQQAAHA